MIITEEERKILQLELFKLSRPAQNVINKLLIDYDKHKCLENLGIEDLPGEIWADIEDYEGIYQVSTKGRVKSFCKGVIKLLRQGFNVNGYPTVSLRKYGKARTHLVHRLVAVAFIPNPENKPLINHKNGIKTDNRVENIEWCTRSENTLHALRTGLVNPKNLGKCKGEKHGRHKLTSEQVLYIRKNVKKGDKNFSYKALSVLFNVSPDIIRKIDKGILWKCLLNSEDKNA